MPGHGRCPTAISPMLLEPLKVGAETRWICVGEGFEPGTFRSTGRDTVSAPLRPPPLLYLYCERASKLIAIECVVRFDFRAQERRSKHLK